IVLFDYDASRGGTVPKRLLQGYRGILLSDGYEPYATVAAELGLVHAACMAHARRKFDEARKATPGDSSHARSALDFIRELYLIELGSGASGDARAAARGSLDALSADHDALPRLARGAELPGFAREPAGESRALHARSVAEADRVPLSRRSAALSAHGFACSG